VYITAEMALHYVQLVRQLWTLVGENARLMYMQKFPVIFQVHAVLCEWLLYAAGPRH